jgi:hypothetical protein
MTGILMAAEIELADKFDMMNKVVEAKLTGQNLTQIAKSLGMTRAQVNEYYEMWKNIAADSGNMKARAREALSASDMHYDKLIKALYGVIDEADDWQAGEGVDAKMLSIKTAAIKGIADLESTRVKMLKDAGLLDDQELAQQILDTERKQEVLVRILKEVTFHCENCSKKVAERLREVTNEAVAVRVV